MWKVVGGGDHQSTKDHRNTKSTTWISRVSVITYLITSGVSAVGDSSYLWGFTYTTYEFVKEDSEIKNIEICKIQQN